MFAGGGPLEWMESHFADCGICKVFEAHHHEMYAMKC